MAYNVHAQDRQLFKHRYKSKNPVRHTSDRMSDDDYQELNNFHHDDERYTNHSPNPKSYKRHTENYMNRFRINPDQTFVTIAKSKCGQVFNVNVSGNIHNEDRIQIEKNAASLPSGLTMTLTEILPKLDNL